MPCLIITGHPCAGKTTIAKLVKERALQHPRIDQVVLLNEESACPDWTKQQCYETPAAEKKSRAALKSAFDRAVTNTTSTTLVILDSLNYIKGFRYELHCVSKAASERHGVLWVLNRQDVLDDWNKKTKKKSSSSSQEQEDSTTATTTTTPSAANGDDEVTYSYEPKLLQELVQRYEPPDARNRWDKPLYTIDVSPRQEENNNNKGNDINNSLAAKSDALQRSVYNMHALGETLGQGSSSPSPANSSTTTTKMTPGEGGGGIKRPTKSAFQRVKKPVAKSAFTPATTIDTGVDNTASGRAQDASTSVISTVVQTGTTGMTSSETKPSPPITQPQQDSSQMAKTTTTTTTITKQPTLEQQVDSILDSFLLNVAPLKEGISTQRHIAGNANALQDLDATTQRLVTAIIQAQNSHTGGCGGSLTVVLQPTSKTDTSTTFSISHYQRPRSLPELRRLRKQYLQWAASHPPEETSTLAIATHFWRFIQTKETKIDS